MKKKEEKRVTQMVEVALKRIEEAIPGEFGQIECGSEKISVPKARIISVFKWMIEQTVEFRVSVLFNFKYGLAQAIGLLLGHILHSRLKKFVSEMKEKKIRVPEITMGCHNSSSDPFILFSDIDWNHGTQRDKLEGVVVINIHDPTPTVEETVLLNDIPL